MSRITKNQEDLKEQRLTRCQSGTKTGGDIENKICLLLSMGTEGKNGGRKGNFTEIPDQRLFVLAAQKNTGAKEEDLVSTVRL